MSATISKSGHINVDGLSVNSMREVSLPKLYAVYRFKSEVVTNSDPSKNRPPLFDRLNKDILPKYPRFLSGSRRLDLPSLKPIIWLDYETEELCLLKQIAVD